MPNDPRNRVIFEGWIFEPFSPVVARGEFDCGDQDLNEFFRYDLIPHEEQLITKTFTLSPEETPVEQGFSPVAFISFCNDAIHKKEFKTDDAQQAVQVLPCRKRYRTFPAVKIARLGVNRDCQGEGVGTFLLNVTKALFRCYNRTGCRFLTVDAYNKTDTLKFYTNNDFAYLTDKDRGKAQRIMFFDLKRVQDKEVETVAAALSYPSI